MEEIQVAELGVDGGVADTGLGQAKSIKCAVSLDGILG